MKTPFLIFFMFTWVIFIASCSKDNNTIADPSTQSSSSSLSSSQISLDSLDSLDSLHLDSNKTDSINNDSSTTASKLDYPANIVDDFEDGDHVSAQGGSWYTFGNTDSVGTSVMLVTKKDGQIIADGEGYDNSKFSLHGKYKLDQGNYEWDPYASIGVTLNEDASFDATMYDGIKYFYKGAAHTFRIEMNSINDYCFHEKNIKASSEWKEVVLKFSDLKQEDWGKQVDFDKSDLRAFAWTITGTTGDSGDIYIDSVSFVDSIPTILQNNMTIKDADVPTEDSLGDLSALTNPLQKKAMKYLNKGINLTNWLEENTKFDGTFDYDKATIKKYADLGFKAIRLPIDLDKYIINREEVLAGTADFKIDSLIFTPIDSMLNWTKEFGLSLTIDYHQYDNSLNAVSVKDSIYKSVVSNCWKAVAKRYSSNNREDVFYELTNEPGIGDDIPPSDWDILAKQMLDSIRTVDTFHSVLFGESRWYDISALVKFTPFNDPNVIYVFHNYDPFIFSHQGASWAGFGSTKNIPFPYSKELWSTEYSYFGFSDDMPSWQLDQLKNYYRSGNKTAIKNSMILAKNWAIKNNVPLICNEFGVYNKVSDPQSIVNYFTAVNEIFTELEIPWQVWFGVFDNSNNVYPGVKEALSL